MKKLNLKLFIVLLIFAQFLSCSNDNNNKPVEPIAVVPEPFIRATDISFLPEIESEGVVFYNNNIPENAMTTLKNAGCNYIRIRLWHTPANEHSGMQEVKTLAQRVRQNGMKVWLTVHYSDTWADPGNQLKPAAWQNINFTPLKNNVANYTTTIMNEINPDIIQIGNETNDGFIYPNGRLTADESSYLQLVETAVSAVRNASSTTKIMLHFAGITGAEYFFNKVRNINYDYIGLSYYPVWHGKSLENLNNIITSLGQTYNKKVIIAETAYPFTLNWEDSTNNIVGLPDQLIPEYPATPEGQRNFMFAIKNLLKQNTNANGFCYWGAEYVAFRGNTATNGSTHENQALWDFDNNVLPVMEAFNEN